MSFQIRLKIKIKNKFLKINLLHKNFMINQMKHQIKSKPIQNKHKINKSKIRNNFRIYNLRDKQISMIIKMTLKLKIKRDNQKPIVI